MTATRVAPALTSTQRKRAFVSMLIMVPLAGAATDIYIPSLPAMVKAFGATEFSVQSTLLVYMVFYGAGQIVAGPLTDTFGRRRPILLSTLVFVLASVGIARASELGTVITLRAVQGLFAACSAVGARAIVADCYEGAARSKAANWMTIAWATGPILSPALGGYLQEWFGWTASFWVLAGWGGLVLFVAFAILPETRRTRPAGGLRGAFAIYRTMVVDPVYVPTAIGMACLVSVMYGFEVLAPFYIQNDLGHSAVQYGHLQFLLGCLWLSGNLVNRILSVRMKVIRIITAGAGISLLVSITMLILDLRGVFSVAAIVIPSGIIYFLLAMIWPNAFAKCLGRFPDAGGSANALASGLFVVVSAVFSLAASSLHSPTAWPMWALFTFVSAVTWICFGWFLRAEFADKAR